MEKKEANGMNVPKQKEIPKMPVKEKVKLYRREIKPMCCSHGTQGFSPKTIPIRGYNRWYPEDSESLLREKLEPDFKKSNGWEELIFEERFVYDGERCSVRGKRSEEIEFL